MVFLFVDQIPQNLPSKNKFIHTCVHTNRNWRLLWWLLIWLTLSLSLSLWFLWGWYHSYTGYSYMHIYSWVLAITICYVNSWIMIHDYSSESEHLQFNWFFCSCCCNCIFVVIASLHAFFSIIVVCAAQTTNSSLLLIFVGCNDGFLVNQRPTMKIT